MDRYAASARIVTSAIAFLFGFLALFVALNDPGPISDQWRLAGNVALIICGIAILGPGAFLWLTGFRRYKSYFEGHPVRFAFYLSATALYASYIQIRVYEKGRIS